MSFDMGNISKADAAAYSSSDSNSDEEDYPDIVSGDPRSDYLDDFKPRKRRRVGHNSKESAALGIFGSDSEDDRPSRKRQSQSKKPLWHQPTSFVSAGQNKSDIVEGKEQDEYEDIEEEDEYAEPAQFGLGNKTAAIFDEVEDDEYDDDNEDATAGIGLGFRAQTGGLGRAPSIPTKAPVSFTKSNDGPTQQASPYSARAPLGGGFVPSSAKEPVLKAEYRDVSDTPKQVPKPSVFSKGGGGGGAKMSFAQRMMAKMGYKEGQGLGAEGQGRDVIIEAVLRPQGVGLGAVKEKSKQERDLEKRQARERGEEVMDSDEEEKKRKQKLRERRNKGLESGSASGSSTPRRPKTKYLTVNDIKKAAPGLHIPDAFAPILDMTGPGQRLLTPGSGLMTPTAGTSTEMTDVIEARKLAGRAQRDLNAFVEEWKTLEERKAWLDMEGHQRQQELDELQGDFEKMQIVASTFDQISQATAQRQWDPVIAGLKHIESLKSIDDDLAAVAVGAIHPFLRDAVQGWQPLEDPKLGNFAGDLDSIKGILGLNNSKAAHKTVAKWDQEVDSTHRQHQKSTTPFESMIYKVLFPMLVTTITQQWDVHDPTPLLNVFDRWEPLFPNFVRAQLIEQLVRRLDEAIGSWKPKSKQRHNLPHVWLFPWLQHLPTYHLEPRGTGIVAEVRRKFQKLIRDWQFDRGVIPGLSQWKDVFRPSKSQDQWKPLVMHHILPSMAKYLRVNFRVDPADQEPYLPMLNGVMKWKDIIAPSMITEVIVAEVFPMWHDVLHQWLTSDDANYEEIGAWFEWWQETALADLSGMESVAAEFNRGTEMITRALDLGGNAKHLPKPDGQPAHRPKPRSKLPADVVVTPVSNTDPVEVTERSFRQEVEDWCNDNDLRFIPTHKSTDSGQKYYRVTARMDGKGGVLAYFEKGGDVLVAEGRKQVFKLRPNQKNDQNQDWSSLLGHLDSENR